MINYLLFLLKFTLTILIGVIFANQFSDSIFMYSLLITTMLGLSQLEFAKLQNKEYN
jgi:hypothetical protein